MELKLAKKKLFEGMEIECYEDVSRNNGDFFMTRKQITEALGYSKDTQFNVILSRHRENIGEATYFNLKQVEGERLVDRSMALYSFNQLFQILRFSKQPKANLFMDWTSITLQELITGRAELKFASQKDESTYKEKIDKLSDKVDIMDKDMKMLIDSATINSHQAQKLNKTARDRVKSILGGTQTPKYKKEARRYFKQLWLNVCDKFEVTSYKDLNPLNINDATTFIQNWSML